MTDEGVTPAEGFPLRSTRKREIEQLEDEPQSSGVGINAVCFSVAALIGSCFVVWLFPLALVAVYFGVLAVRRPLESSVQGWWAISLATLSLIYSAWWAWNIFTLLQY